MNSRAPVKRKRAGRRRVSVDRIPKYLAWLREQRCAIPELPERYAGFQSWATTEAAHTTNNGRGSKGADSGCLPLCMAHHREQHQIGVKAFEARYRIDLKAVAAQYFERYQQEKR